MLCIGKSAAPRRQLIADLGLRQESRRNFYANYMRPAMARGLVCMMIPGAPSSPDQAYQLTANGLDFLEELRQETESKKDQAE